MRNLIPLGGMSDVFFDNTIARKEDAGLVARLVQARPDLMARYQVYDEAFASNTLESVARELALSAIGADVQKVYTYGSVAFRNFREHLAAQQPLTVRYKCQYCTVTPNESLDHYLPQSRYPEFSIHTLNLVPCCKTCNGYKLNVFLVGNRRQFINFYLDELPLVQYLFVNITADATGELKYDFYLQNVGNVIAPELFARLESHYRRLHLFERMRKESITDISEFFDLIGEYSARLTQQETIDEVIRLTTRSKQSYGHNHYMAILKEALINNPLFMNIFTWT